MALVGFTVSMIVLIVTIIAVIVGIYYLLTKYRASQVPPNSSLVLSFMPERSDGYALFSLVGTPKSDWTDRKVLELNPIDVRFDVKGNPIIPRDNKNVPVSVGKIVHLPVGSLSSYRDMKIILPEDAMHIPKSLQKTDLGMALMNLSELARTRDEAIKMIQEGTKQRNQVIKDLQTGEATKDWLRKQKQFYESMVVQKVERATKDKGTEKSEIEKEE